MAEYSNNLGLDYSSPIQNNIDNSLGLDYKISDSGSVYEDKQAKLERSAELKRKRLNRKGELQYEDDGSLIHDSNAMIRAKEVANAGIKGTDWMLEASENLVDFGQGDWIDHYDGFKAEHEGKRYSMNNKDFIAGRATTTEQLKQDYHNATHDPNADKGIYTLRKFDGYDDTGSEKFIYKYGLAEVGADARYRDQWVQDGYDIVEEKRFAGAEDWEKAWNASQGVLDARTLDNSFDLVQDEQGNMVTRDEASGIRFGSGKTELLNQDLLGTDIGKTKEDYSQNKEYSQRLSAMADAKWQSGMSSNPVDAFQSGLASLGVDTADFILDVLTPGGDNTLLNEVKKKENIDKWVGYDRTQSTQALSDAATYWNQGEYVDSIMTVLADPNTMAESLPMMLGMMAPIPGTRAATAVKLAKALNIAKKAGKAGEIKFLTAQLRQATNAKEFAKFKELGTLSNKTRVLNHFAQNAGFHTVAGSMTNNVLDDRIANKIAAGEKGEVSMMEALGVYAVQLPLLAIDRMSFETIIGMPGAKRALKSAFGMADRAGKQEILAKIASKAGGLVAAGAGEGAQEYVQTWGEILGAKVGVDGKSIGDVLIDEESQREALMGGLGGLGAGVQMRGVSEIPGIAKSVWQKGYDSATTKEWEKAMKRVHSVSDMDKEPDLTSGTIKNGIVQEILAGGNSQIKDFDLKDTKSFKDTLNIAVRQRMANITDQPDSKEILEQKFSIEIFEKALEFGYAELKKGNKAPLEHTLALIKKVNDDPDINFKTEDIQKKVNEGYAEKLSEIITKEYTLQGIDKDLEIDIASSEGQSKAKETKKAAMNKDLDDLIKEIQGEELQQQMLKQGAMLNLGDKDIAEIDDVLLETESDLSLTKLKELILEYRSTDDVKVHQQVKDEIQKFGYIKEKNRKYNKTTKETTSDITLKPSMNSYDRVLDEQFLETDKTKNLLEKTVEKMEGPTLGKFVAWTENRFTKNQPSVRTVAGEEIITPVNRTARNLIEMVKENKWFETKVKRLKTLIEMHEVGENKLPEAKKEAIKTELAKAETSMENAEIQIQKHKTNLEEWISETLGLDGFDWNNPKHVAAITDVSTTLDLDENKNEIFGKQNVGIMSNEKYNTLEKTYGYKQSQLMQEVNGKVGMKQNENFIDYRDNISKETTGSEQTGTKKKYTTTSQNEKTYAQEKEVVGYKTGEDIPVYNTVTPKIEPETKTDKSKSSKEDIKADKKINAENYINEITEKINKYETVSLDDVQLFTRKIENILSRVSNVDKKIVGKSFEKIADKLLESINKDKEELKETSKEYHEAVGNKKSIVNKMKSLMQSIVRKIKGLFSLGKKTIKNVEQKEVLLKSMKDISNLIRTGSDQDKILAGLKEANNIQAILNGMFVYFGQDGVKLDRRILNKMNLTEDQLKIIGETYDKYHKSINKFKRSKYGPYVDGRKNKDKSKPKTKPASESKNTKKERTKESKLKSPEPETNIDNATMSKEDQKIEEGFEYSSDKIVNETSNIESEKDLKKDAYASIEEDVKTMNETKDEGC